jgi:hypothetical protein
MYLCNLQLDKNCKSCIGFDVLTKVNYEKYHLLVGEAV